MLLMMETSPAASFFFFNDTATTEIYTLSLHDALPISQVLYAERNRKVRLAATPNDDFVADQYALRRISAPTGWSDYGQDRKSTRLNSSHANISYAVFCLKNKEDKRHRHALRHLGKSVG